MTTPDPVDFIAEQLVKHVFGQDAVDQLKASPKLGEVQREIFDHRVLQVDPPGTKLCEKFE